MSRIADASYIDWAGEVANYLRRKQSQTSRFAQQVLHISDVIGCHIKLYLMRTFDTAHRPGVLATFAGGNQWEDEIYRGVFEPHGYVSNHAFEGRIYIGRCPVRGRPSVPPERVVPVIARPDFARRTNGHYDSIVELKTTRWTKKSTQCIVHFQADTLDRIGTPLPPYPPSFREPRQLTCYGITVQNPPKAAFMNAIMQCAAYYDAAMSSGQATSTTSFELLYIHRDLIEHHYLPADLLNAYRAPNGPFYFRIPAALFALAAAGANEEVLHYYNEPTVQRFMRWIVYKLWWNELHTYGLYNYIGCQYCPFYTLRVCPTLPVLRSPYEQDLEAYPHMKQWLTDFFTQETTTPMFTFPPIPTVATPPRRRANDNRQFIINLRNVTPGRVRLRGEPQDRQTTIVIQGTTPQAPAFHLVWLKDEEREYTRPGMPGYDMADAVTPLPEIRRGEIVEQLRAIRGILENL